MYDLDYISLELYKIEKINNRKYKIFFTNKLCEQFMECKKLYLKVPFYKDEKPLIIFDECKFCLELICREVYKIKFHHTIPYLDFVLHFNEDLNYCDINAYVAHLINSNINNFCNPEVKLVKYQILLDDVLLEKELLHNSFNMLVYNQNNVLSSITKNNIINDTLIIPSDTIYIQAEQQVVYDICGVKYFTTDCKKYYIKNTLLIEIKIYRSFVKNVKIGCIHVDPCLEKNKILSTVYKYGKYDIIMAKYPHKILATDLNLNNKYQPVYLPNKFCEVKVIPKIVLNSRTISVFDMTSSTSLHPACIDSEFNILGDVHVYKKYAGKSRLDVFIQSRFDKCHMPVPDILNVCLLDECCVEYIYKPSDYINPGIYNLKWIEFCNENVFLTSVSSTEILVENGVNKEIIKTIKLHKEGKYYYPECEYNFIVYKKSAELMLLAEYRCVERKLRCVPTNFIYGWYIDISNIHYLKERIGWELDLEKRIGDNVHYKPIAERIRHRRLNNLILAFMNNKDNKVAIGCTGYRFEYLNTNCVKSKNFYSNIIYWKSLCNANNCLLGISIGGVEEICDMPGELKDYELCKLNGPAEELERFIEDYCNPSNKRFIRLLKFIVSIHYISNYVDWDLERNIMKYPGYILFIARIYKLLEEELYIYNLENELVYTLSLPTDIGTTDTEMPDKSIGGFNHCFKHIWKKFNYGLLICKDRYKNPWFINGLTMSVRSTSRNTNNLEKYIAKAVMVNDDILMEILNTKDENDLRKRCITSVWIQKYEPQFSEKYRTDQEYIYKVSSQLKRDRRLGILNWSDRNTESYDDRDSINVNECINPDTFDDGFIPIRNHHTNPYINAGFKDTDHYIICSILNCLDKCGYFPDTTCARANTEIAEDRICCN
jgi:hypothetical protein